MMFMHSRLMHPCVLQTKSLALSVYITPYFTTSVTWNQTQQKDIHHSLLDHLDTEKSLIRRNLSRYSDEFEKLKATLRSLHFDLDVRVHTRDVNDASQI